MREILRDLLHLGRSRVAQARGNLRLGGRPAIVRLILIIIGGAMLIQGIYWGAYRFLYWIISRTDYVGGILTGVFVDYLLLIAMAILLLSTLIAALAVFLLSEDLKLLRSTPVREEALFLDRLGAVWLQSAWMPLIFVVPILLGFLTAWQRYLGGNPAVAREPDLSSFAYLILIGLPALTLIPAALSGVVALLIGRFVSASRLRNGLIAGTIIGSIGLYGAGQYLRVDQLFTPEAIEDFMESMKTFERQPRWYLPTDWLAEGLDFSLHGDLASAGLFADTAVAGQARERLVEQITGVTNNLVGDDPVIVEGIEGLVYGKRPTWLPHNRTWEITQRVFAGLPILSVEPPERTTPLWSPLVLWGISILFIALGMLLAAGSYPAAYSRAQEGRREGVAGSEGRLGTLLERLVKGTPGANRLFFYKDLLVFVRDPALWSQLLVLVGMILVTGWGFRAAAERSNLTELARYLPYAQAVLYSLGIWAGTLLTSAIAARMVYPQVSLEGEGFWLVRTSPITMQTYLRAKLVQSMLPTVVLGAGLAAGISYTLNFDYGLAGLAVTVGALNAFVACCLGVGIGASLPEFNYVNISRLFQGPGGILFISLSMGFATLITMTSGGYVAVITRGTADPLRAGFFLLLLPGVIGLLGAALALRIGVRRLETLVR
ncbi:MAG: hypothetical protein VX405_11820 [Myxococcota bacterium]|nr:hypothetical protein [Myxococcota bacterium]